MNRSFHRVSHKYAKETSEMKTAKAIFKAIFNIFSLIFRKSRKKGKIDKEYSRSCWHKIENLVATNQISDLKNALILADNLMDYVMKANNCGDNLGQRLKNHQGKFNPATYQLIWKGHKLRNQLVHEIDAEIFHFQIKQSIEDFKQGLEELGAL